MMGANGRMMNPGSVNSYEVDMVVDIESGKITPLTKDEIRFLIVEDRELLASFDDEKGKRKKIG